MEYQNNNSEYFQKNDKEGKLEYFINASPNGATGERKNNIKQRKFRIKTVMFILTSSVIVLAAKQGITKPVFAEPVIDNRVITDTEVPVESSDSSVELIEETIPEEPELYERSLSAAELQYLESIKQALDSEDYKTAGDLITNNSIFQELISSCEWKEDKRIGFFINDKKALENGSGNGMCLYIKGKRKSPTIYYGGIEDGYATGSGIMLNLDQYGVPQYYIGSWQNGYPNGYGEDYGPWYWWVTDPPLLDGICVLSGTFVDGYAEGTSTYTITYTGENNSGVESYTFISHDRTLEVAGSITLSTDEYDEEPYVLVNTEGERTYLISEEDLVESHWIAAMHCK